MLPRERPRQLDNSMIFHRFTNMRVPLSLTSSLPPWPKGLAGRRIRRPAALALAFASIALMLAGVSSGPANAENPDISSRRAAERTDFTNDEIKDGFFKIAFSAELQLGVPVERVRKFDEPVRIFVVSKGLPDRRSEIAAIVADIRARVNHLDVAVTDDRQAANFVVRLVADRELSKTIRSHYGNGKAKQIQQSLNPQC